MEVSLTSQNDTNESTVSVYRGHALCVNVWKGKLRGRIHYLGQRLFAVNEAGTEADAQQLLAKLKEEVDRDLPGKEQALARLKEKHTAFMAGRPSELGSLKPTDRSPLTPHCWKCKRRFDGSLQYEHTTCGWIVCTGCGACKCGSGFGQESPSMASMVTGAGGSKRATVEPSLDHQTVGHKRSSRLKWLVVAGAALGAILGALYLLGAW